jgi:hypothetical protein
MNKLKVNGEIIEIIDCIGIKNIKIDQLDIDNTIIAKLYFSMLTTSRNLKSSYKFLDKYYDQIDFNCIIMKYSMYNDFLRYLSEYKLEIHEYITKFMLLVYNFEINLESKTRFKQKIIELLKEIKKNYSIEYRLHHVISYNSILFLIEKSDLPNKSDYVKMLTELFFIVFHIYKRNQSFFDILKIEKELFEKELDSVIDYLYDILENKEYKIEVLVDLLDFIEKIDDSYDVSRNIILYNKLKKLTILLVSKTYQNGQMDFLLEGLDEVSRVEYLMYNQQKQLEDEYLLRLSFLNDVNRIKERFQYALEAIYIDITSETLLNEIRDGLIILKCNHLFEDYMSYNSKILDLFNEYFSNSEDTFTINSSPIIFNELYKIYAQYSELNNKVFEIANQHNNLSDDSVDFFVDVYSMLEEVEDLLTNLNVFRSDLFSTDNISYIKELINIKQEVSSHETIKIKDESDKQQLLKDSTAVIIEKLSEISASKFYRDKYKPLTVDQIKQNIKLLFNQEYDWFKLMVQAEYFLDKTQESDEKIYDWSFIYILYAKAIENLLANLIELSFKNNNIYYINKKNPPHRVDIRLSSWRTAFNLKELQTIIKYDVASLYDKLNDTGLFDRRIRYLFKLDRNKFLHKEILFDYEQLVLMHRENIYQLIYLILSVL